jgi:hypothetical protein
MAECLVTGIAPTSDPAELEKLFAGRTLDTTRLAIIGKATQPGTPYEHLGMVGGTLSTSSTIMTGSGGTGVPGMGSSGASFSSSGAHGEVPNYLGGLPMIPADQAEHFNIAIAEGRSLVTYKAEEPEAMDVQALFREAGLRNVKVFKPKVPA